MESFPDAQEYFDGNDFLWWADAQQIIIRSIGYELNLNPQNQWVHIYENTLVASQELVASLSSAINPSDPYCFINDSEGNLQYVSSEERAKYLSVIGEEYVISVLKYLNGDNPFDDDELPSLLRKDSPRFLPRLMEFQMLKSLGEHFVHSSRLISGAIAFSDEIQNWTIPIPSVEDQENVPKPSPQPYGVSHEGAESLVKDWMLYLGMPSAEVTRYSGDGGVDVASSTYVAQVKNYRDLVGVQAIREILGVAVAEGKKPLFFTSGSFTSEALSFAEKANIPLFIYDAAKGNLERVNTAAENLYSQRSNVSEEELLEEIQTKLMQASFCLLSLKGALKTSKRLLKSFVSSSEDELEILRTKIDRIDCSAAALRSDIKDVYSFNKFSELVDTLRATIQELSEVAIIGGEVITISEARA
jgi:hypothetical protein